jgi:hypothetical protein
MEFMESLQFPEAVRSVLSPPYQQWFVSDLASDLIKEGHLRPYDPNEPFDIYGPEATMFIIRKDWNTERCKRVRHHVGFVFARDGMFQILHNRHHTVVPQEYGDQTGVVSHAMDSIGFRSLCDLWSSEVLAQSHGGGTVKYTLYY